MLLNLLLIVLIEGACDGPHIILTDKKASQSSNYTSYGIPYSADRAFDGNRSTCSHTLQETTSWWSIDLQGVYNISCISIYNVNLLNHETNLSGAKIYIGNSRQNNGTNNTLLGDRVFAGASLEHRLLLQASEREFQNITALRTDQTNVYKFSQSGRYVVIIPENNFIILCEVNITGTKMDSPFLLINQDKTWEEALNYYRENHKDLASKNFICAVN